MTPTLKIPQHLLKTTPKYYIQSSSVDRRLVKGNLKGKKILNIGCGKTMVSDVFFTLRGAKVISLDLDMDQLKQARLKLNQCVQEKSLKKSQLPHLVLGNGESLNYKDSTFDYIVTYSAIEHTYDKSSIPKAIAEAIRVLKPGGKFIITGPNLLNLPVTILSWLFHKRRNVPEHRFTPRSLRRLLTSQGLIIEEQDAESVYIIDKDLIETRFPWLWWLPKVIFRTTSKILEIMNLSKAYNKTFGMRIGFRARKTK
jgi:ubiquinone/menaquinone biosynthesis C-methylase UbiE